MKLLKSKPHSKIIYNASWKIGVKIYQVAINLVVSLLMARYLGPSNYGLINYAASFTALFSAFCTLGLNSILVNELIDRPEDQGKMLGTSIAMRLISSGLSVATITALAYAMNPNEKTTVLVVLVYSTTLVLQSFDTFNHWYQANMELKTAAVFAAMGYTAAAVYKVYLLIAAKSVIWFAAAHVVEYLVVAALLLADYWRKAQKQQKLRICCTSGKDLLDRSHHFILSGLMVALYGQMDRVMLKAMLDETAVGYYSAAAAITTMWPFVLVAIIDAVRPVILGKYKTDRELFEKYMTRLYGVILYISIAVAICITIFSMPIIQILYGQAYSAAQGTLCILCWDTAFSYLGVARSIWLVPQGKQKYEKYIAMAGAIFNLAMNGIMIPVWGVNGAAFATLFTQIFTNAIVGFFFKDVRKNNQLILRSVCIWRYWK